MTSRFAVRDCTGRRRRGRRCSSGPHHPNVDIYRGYEREFAAYTQRFGPQLRISDEKTEEAVSDARGEGFRPVREALFAQDMAGFNAALAELYDKLPACELERVRLSRF